MMSKIEFLGGNDLSRKGGSILYWRLVWRRCSSGAVVLGTIIAFGLGTVAMPFLLLVLMPRDAVVIVTAMIILTTGLTVAQTWRHLRLRETWPFLVAGLPPVPVGGLALHEFNPTALRVIIAVVVLAVGCDEPCSASACRARAGGGWRRW